MIQASAAGVPPWPCSAILSLVVGVGIANAQTAAPIEAPAMLNAVDFNFVGQAELGAPFQVESGRIAETRAPAPRSGATRA